ncbi:MAG: FkbM family methyltransferase, partial [Luteolibacter sp.]
MKIGKIIERAAKSIILTPATLARYGTLRPTRVRLDGCTNWIHIDPTDRRSIKKFVHDPLRRRISPPLAFWRDFLEKLNPEVAMDVGVNYGECLFGARYAEKIRVYGFEANPRLAPYLQKSRNDHPDAERITIVEGLVSDAIADDIPFYADPSWSGTGSAVSTLNDGPNVVTTRIKARTIDSVIARDRVEDATLLFKMDIEGYEPRAFDGFWETIGAAKLAVGFIEFDTTYIREAGGNPESYFGALSRIFDIHRLSNGKPGKLVKVRYFADLPVSRAADQRIPTDLLLSTLGANTAAWFPSHRPIT